MNAKIKRFDSIKNAAVFQDFNWPEHVKDGCDNIVDFKTINIFYGRNYSGKTTLSRILRAMELNELPEKFDNLSFDLIFSDGTQVKQDTLTGHNKNIRVFNEDFVKDNLRFITDPDDSIEPFAIFGDDNNKIEKEIEVLEKELGSKEEGKQTGLYAKQIEAASIHGKAEKEYKKAEAGLNSQLSKKATDRNIGIKYKPERFGDQNYNIQKLKADIEEVIKPQYQSPDAEHIVQYEKLIAEHKLPTIPPFQIPSLNILTLIDETETLIIKEIGNIDKIEELVKDAVLNSWVKDGLTHHKSKRDHCAFCGNSISENRWKKLENHFDEESKKLEKDIEGIIAKVDTEKTTVSSALSIDKSLFYSKYHDPLQEVENTLKGAIEKHMDSLESLTNQLTNKKNKILSPVPFKKPDSATDGLETSWNSYEEVRKNSNQFSGSLNEEQSKARKALRLKEVSEFLSTIQYQEQLSSIQKFKQKYDNSAKKKDHLDLQILQKEELVISKKRELNDEEKGAQKVNQYLNDFCGHQHLSLEAIKSDFPEENSKQIRFEVIRDSKKAYHLSEGERSLLAFCYFLAKLGDIETMNSKPIIWIDDPISSLDSNHIFFIYSLIDTEVVTNGNFDQLFISTHNLDFLKYLIRLNGKFFDTDGKQKDFQKAYFIVARQDKESTIQVMPKYLKEYVTEFNYLFHHLHQCAEIDTIDDSNYPTFYNFANNARKFFEIYLYYKYPDQGMNKETLRLFFGEKKIPAVLTDRINNEYSHLKGTFERGSTPVEVPEMQTAARQIIDKLKEDKDQYSALLKSVGLNDNFPE